MKFIGGAFRVLRRRANEVGQPGLTVWTDAGEKAVEATGCAVTKLAHGSECADREALREIEAGLQELHGLRARREALKHFQRAERLVSRSAEMDHDIGEAVAS